MNTKQPSFLEFLPVSLFGAVIAMTGLAYSWEWASKMFNAPSWIRNIFALLALIIFIALMIAYLIKCIRYSSLVKKEFDHPVSVSFFGTILISFLLLPGIILPYSETIAICMWCVGVVGMLLFAWIVLRKWLDHPQDPANAVPGWVIPIVGTLDVPIVGYRLPIPGVHEICVVFFGIGLIFGIIVMTIIFSRLIFQPAMPEALKPTLLILVGPFALAFSGYESLTGQQDMMASIFFYFDLFLLLVLGSKIFLIPQCCPFRVTWWAVGFPLAAITIASFRYASNKVNSLYHILPAVLLAVTTAVIVYILIQSIYRLLTRQFLLPKPANEKAMEMMEPIASTQNISAGAAN